jgi:hypothetical protein
MSGDIPTLFASTHGEYLRQGSDALRYFQLPLEVDWRSEIISRLVRHHTEVREEQGMTGSSTC